ncbi:MAG: DUF1573 domain-containing protein [Armatimonadetes bacterium]|nr:DUF1573 domain-containing protein [Armatimonadota bacterium]
MLALLKGGRWAFVINVGDRWIQIAPAAGPIPAVVSRVTFEEQLTGTYLRLRRPAVDAARKAAVRVTEPISNVGHVKSGEVIRVEFTAVNLGPEPTTLGIGLQSCACTTAVIGSPTVAAGDSTHIAVEVRPVAPYVRETVGIRTGDPHQPLVFVSVVGGNPPVVFSSAERVTINIGRGSEQALVDLLLPPELLVGRVDVKPDIAECFLAARWEIQSGSHVRLRFVPTVSELTPADTAIAAIFSTAGSVLHTLAVQLVRQPKVVVRPWPLAFGLRSVGGQARDVVRVSGAREALLHLRHRDRSGEALQD